ncbi:MAG: hypothetical protein KF710_09680 [Rhodocyclaceae bacterium]|nr:hypothetical protein [Rhodocyclaceae bacterium]
MPYTHFRYIAYEVPTAVQDRNAVFSGFKPGLPCPAVPRIPVVKIPNLANAKNRLLRLASIVDLAKIRIDQTGTDNQSTLKVFVAPEFYFRPENSFARRNCPYNTYSYDEAVEIFDELDSMFAHPDFTDWLIVAGTVLWHWDNKDDERPNPNEPDPGGLNVPSDPNGRVYRNTAPYVRGGISDSLKIIEKRVPSGIDGVPNPYAPKPDAYDDHFQKTFESWHSQKEHVFEIDSVRCGLEVCLDHADAADHRVLRTVLEKWHQMENAAPPAVDLHILTAGGMTIQEGAVAARPNGYILRNDGYSNYPFSELRRVSRYSLFGWAMLAANKRPEDVVPLTGPQKLDVPGADFHTQQLVFYPSTSL